MHKDFLRDLAIFLVGLGKNLREVLANIDAHKESPKFQIWLESAKRLGVIVEENGELRVNKEALKDIKRKLREVFEEWMSDY